MLEFVGGCLASIILCRGGNDKGEDDDVDCDYKENCDGKDGPPTAFGTGARDIVFRIGGRAIK